MNRRQLMFRVGELLLIVPASAWLAACSKESGLTVTSTADSTGHTHSYTISGSDLSSPPTGGINNATTTSSGHAHTVELSAAELASIAAGNSVTKTSSSVSHTHSFTFLKT